ncbi:hypothetical protein, partial [Shewanella surugensis]
GVRSGSLGYLSESEVRLDHSNSADSIFVNKVRSRPGEQQYQEYDYILNKPDPFTILIDHL